LNQTGNTLASRPVIFNCVFVFFLTLVILSRLFLFLELNLSYIDTDQPLMWLGATDYSKGNFFEPRYYGQNYNTFMEGLFAVPLLWITVPVYKAVPAATHFIFLFPFLFTAGYLFARGKKANSILVLATLLCLPVEHDILTGIPRGFVTGLFFCSFFALSVLDPGNQLYLALNTAMSVLGFYVNPNSILVTGPLLFYLMLLNYKTRRFYLSVGVGVCCIIIFYFVFNWFYRIHPHYVLIPLDLTFHPEDLWYNISHLDEKFAHVTFFRQGQSGFLLIVMLVSGVVLFRHNRPAACAYLVFLLLILLSFCFRKNIEGSMWPFFSYSRMYVSIPLTLCLFVGLIDLSMTRLIFVLTGITIVFSTYKLLTMEQAVVRYTQKEPYQYVTLVPLKSALDAIDFYRSACESNGCNFLLISTGFWLNSILNYGGPAIHNDYPSTRETIAERRYRVRNDEKARERFIFISPMNDFEKLNRNSGFEITRLDNYGMYLITSNTLSMSNFIENVKLVEGN
jgi:hypothetical protein